MSQAAVDSLNRALKRMRDREAFALGWRVISCTSYQGTEESFYYTQGQREPKYPMPAILHAIHFECDFQGVVAVTLWNTSQHPPVCLEFWP